MKTVGNIFWFIGCGWWQGTLYALVGVIMCMTIIGIPIGIALFQMAKLMYFPYGKEIVRTHEIKDVSAVARAGSVIANIIWFPLGLVLAVLDIISGIAACALIVTIPIGIVYFRSAKFIILPSGARVVTKEEAIIKKTTRAIQRDMQSQSNIPPKTAKNIKNNELNNVYQQQLLSSVFNRAEVAELGYIFTPEKAAKLMYFPVENTVDGTWICSCGVKNGSDFCVGCGTSRQEIFNKINIAYISEHLTSRITEENARRAQQNEEKQRERELRSQERREAIQRDRENAIKAFNNAKEACVPIKNKMARNLKKIIKLFRSKWISKDFKVAVLAVSAVIVLAITVLTFIFKTSAIFVSLAIIFAIIVLLLIFGDF